MTSQTGSKHRLKQSLSVAADPIPIIVGSMFVFGRWLGDVAKSSKHEAASQMVGGLLNNG